MKQLSLFHDTNINPIQKNSNTGCECSEWKLYIDGAARNNPGPAGAGIHVLKNDLSIKKEGFYLGKKTNNQAEYWALILGLVRLKQELLNPDHDNVHIISDSQLLIRQFQGHYKVKHTELKTLHDVAWALIHPIKKVEFKHVMREHNTIADKYANIGIDKKIIVPEDVIAAVRVYGLQL